MHKKPLRSVLFLSHESALIVHLLITHAKKCPRVGLLFQGMRLKEIQDKASVTFVSESPLVRVPNTSAFGLFEIVENVMGEFGEYNLAVNNSEVSF